MIAELCNAKLSLVAIPPIDGKPTKAPHGLGWNKPRSGNNPKGYSANAGDFNDCTGFNFGLYHGASHTLALDLDDLALAKKIFEDTTDFQLQAWLENDCRVEIKSPKANRGKLLFRVPKGIDAKLKQFKHDGAVIFELRAGNCQDVIIGKHPEGGDYQLIGNPAQIPDAPAVLLDMLQHWDDWKPCLDSVLSPLPPAKIPEPYVQKGERLPGQRNPIQEFNQSRSVTSCLLEAGYRQVGKDRFIRPGSTSKAPGVVIMNNCADGIERIYSHGGDDLNDGYAHDAFDCHRILNCSGDHTTALKWSPEITKHNQRLHQQSKAAQTPHVDFTAILQPDYSMMPEMDSVPKKPFSMSAFSLSGQSEIMKTKMLADRFVLDRIAILGQATTIYAKPNTGKTLLVLWMLIESIKAGRINGKDVFYINADDDYKGLVFKTSLAEQNGFEMLAPGHNGFESAALQGYMAQMIADGTASGTVIILDTLKKFTDLMNKKTGSEFMNRAREFVANGGTLIMLAHTNKNRDADGKAVFGGTSDIVDDCDCVFMLDEVSKTMTTKQVLFENLKSRGNVASELAFSYSVEENRHYQYRLESVEAADKQSTELAKKDKAIADGMAKNQLAINAITETLDQGIHLKTELIAAAHDCSGISKRQLNTALEKYKGAIAGYGVLWRENIGAKNAKSYHLLVKTETSAADYLAATNGE